MGLTKQQLWNIAEPIIDLVVEKNRLYGDSYFHLRNEYGKIAFMIRLLDKINRLKVLVSNYSGNDYIDTDTIVDIIGYCLLELFYRRAESELRNIVMNIIKTMKEGGDVTS